MGEFSRALLCGAALVAACGCGVPFVPPSLKFNNYDPDRAAVGAVVFAKEAFVDLDQPKAYDLLAEEARRRISFEQYLNVIARMHPQGFPKEVVATGYQPVPNTDALVIWMQGAAGGEQFSYRLTMSRKKAAADYEVAEMFRTERPPPPQSVAPLPEARTTAALY